ncbi:hypothetical protein ACFLWA_10335, partial [Chloroflexota bacterium]
MTLSEAGPAVHPERTTAQHRDFEPARDGSFGDLPSGAAPAIARTLADEHSIVYQLVETSSPGIATYSAENPAQGMRYSFDPDRVWIHSKAGGWTWGLRLDRWGYAEAMLPAPAPVVSASTTEITYQRGPSLTEWYLNTPWGLEQGFTVSRPPRVAAQATSQQASPLTLELKVAGNLEPRLESRTDLGLYAAHGQVARYAGLYAFDAAGQDLPAHLELVGDTLRLVIDDSNARYPVTIDPWIQLAELNAAEGGGA